MRYLSEERPLTWGIKTGTVHYLHMIRFFKIAIVGRGCRMEPKDSLTEKMIKLLTDEMKESLKEEKEESLTDQMKNDSDFQSKRKQLIIVSVLLMAMSLSDASLKEANTFIFKIDFSNSANAEIIVNKTFHIGLDVSIFSE